VVKILEQEERKSTPTQPSEVKIIIPGNLMATYFEPRLSCDISLPEEELRSDFVLPE
jgi:hypothetical protein